MRATGIVRRIDELGRIVIPKEVRRMMRIREGDALECYTTRDGEVIFKKYSFMDCVADLASQLCDSMFKYFGLVVAVTDQDHIIAASGSEKHDLLGQPIGDKIEMIIRCRRFYQHDDSEHIFIGDHKKYPVASVAPIISMGEVLGSALIIGNTDAAIDSDTAYKVLGAIATFLGKQMEDLPR